MTSDSQVLLTTQSPDLVSYFTADELRVVDRTEGSTTIDFVEDNQRQAIEEHLFTGGEFLKVEGLRRRSNPEDTKVA